MVDLMGVEPTTFRLQGGCSPKMSYRPKSRISFPAWSKLSAGGICGIAASLNLYHFIRIGSLHSVALGFEPTSSYYKYDALPIELYDMATHTGLEPVIFCVTGRRINQLSQWAILAPTGAICIRLDFEWLRVFSLIRSQLPGRDSGTRTHTLLRAPAPQAGLSTNSSISPWSRLLFMYWWKVNQNHRRLLIECSCLNKHPTRQGRLGAE